MSREEKQKKIEIIRLETQKGGNTRERVAEILTDLNNDKIERDFSNLSEEGKVRLRELLELSGSEEIEETASGEDFD